MTNAEMVQAVDAAREFIMQGLFDPSKRSAERMGQLAGDLSKVRDELEKKAERTETIPLNPYQPFTGPQKRVGRAWCSACKDYHQATAESEEAAMNQVMEIVVRHNRKAPE